MPFFFLLLFLSVDNADMLLEKSQKMIERFNYPWEMMPLLYVILKYANGDLEEATNQLSEGKQMLMRLTSLVKRMLLLKIIVYLKFQKISFHFILIV